MYFFKLLFLQKLPLRPSSSPPPCPTIRCMHSDLSVLAGIYHKNTNMQECLEIIVLPDDESALSVGSRSRVHKVLTHTEKFIERTLEA